MSEERRNSRGAVPWVRMIGVLLLMAAMIAGFPGGARARGGATIVSGPVFAWVLLDADTGQVLSEQNADVLTYPASLTKMMTLYLTFEALNQGRIRPDQFFSVSAEAASRSPSKLGLAPGEAVPLRDLIFGLITRSANDAASVIAENLAGSETNFARYMTWKARQLGMQHTWYQNASGLPDPSQRTTARDVARLALALYHDFPREYRYFSTQEFYFRGELIRTHNHLLEWYPGSDGIKTGFVNASGFNIATSAVRNGRRLIGVIMGGRSARSRDVQMASLLNQGFAALGTRQPAEPVVAAAQSATYPKLSSSTSIPTAPAVVPAARVAPALASAPAAGSAIAAAEAAAALTDEDDDENGNGGADDRKAGAVRHVTSAALRHLAPVSKAQAAPAVHVAPAAEEGWGVQLGAFRDQSAARQALRRAAGVGVLAGKPQQVLAPPKSDRRGLYRVRVLSFSEGAARNACAELRKRKMECTVVRSAVRLAGG